MLYGCQCDKSLQETKMTRKLTTPGHRTAFNNEQNLYHILGYKRPRNVNVKQFKREKKTTPLFMFKIYNKRKTNTQNIK